MSIRRVLNQLWIKNKKQAESGWIFWGITTASNFQTPESHFLLESWTYFGYLLYNRIWTCLKKRYFCTPPVVFWSFRCNTKSSRSSIILQCRIRSYFWILKAQTKVHGQLSTLVPFENGEFYPFQLLFSYKHKTVEFTLCTTGTLIKWTKRRQNHGVRLDVLRQWQWLRITKVSKNFRPIVICTNRQWMPGLTTPTINSENWRKTVPWKLKRSLENNDNCSLRYLLQ